MYVNSDRKLIYLAHPRTASTATADFLMEHAGFGSMSSHHSRREPMPGTGWKAFTTVRNHFDTILSWAATGLGTEIAKMPENIGDTKWFSDFRAGKLDNSCIADHTLWHLHYEDADEILFYESLEADLSRILEIEVKLPHMNVSKRRGRNWDRYYDGVSYAYVAGRFSEEMRHFGYLKP